MHDIFLTNNSNSKYIHFKKAFFSLENLVPQYGANWTSEATWTSKETGKRVMYITLLVVAKTMHYIFHFSLMIDFVAFKGG